MLGTLCLRNTLSIFWEEVADSGGLSQHSLDLPLLEKHCYFLQTELEAVYCSYELLEVVTLFVTSPIDEWKGSFLGQMSD